MSMYYNRPNPQVHIPTSSQQPQAGPSGSIPWTSPPYYSSADLSSPWESTSDGYLEPPAQPRSRAASYSSPDSGIIPPQMQRSTSQWPLSHGGPAHRYSKSDVGQSPVYQANLASESFAFSDRSGFSDAEDANAEFTPTIDNLSKELSELTLQSEEGLRHFQNGELAASDEEWHRLVPTEAREALGKQEVQRQSVLFEVFKSERDYVADLEAVKDVFIDPIKRADPPIIPQERLEAFIYEVFYNLDPILAHHQRMLAALFDRQREQHPLIQSVADIILDTTLLFTNDYDAYIKHYPLAESRHRTELRRNRTYQTFIEECSHDPRIRKRDLITFLSRPVTRLPRLSLILEQVHKLTDPEHPDTETLPLILGILTDFIKGTQPGIAAAESKVKFWDLCESLVYVKGEIIDLDLYDDSRTMVHSGPLARKQKSDSDHYGWTDLFVALLDNYFLMTREEKSNGAMKRYLVSRPIPLEYLRIAAFDGPSESRKERADDGRLLESLRTQHRTVWPFTVYHAAAKSSRRYTLYSTSEPGRKKWHDALVDAIGVHKARRDANMWFAQRSLTGSYFTRTEGRSTTATNPAITGRILSVAPFLYGTRPFLAVGCETGVYVGPRGESNFRRVLRMQNPARMTALQMFNKFIVQFDTSILSYSLDLLARVAIGATQRETLDASMEKILDGNALFFRTGEVYKRTLLVYAAKGFWDVTLHTLEAIHPSEVPVALSPQRNEPKTKSFRPFGEPITAPKDVHDVTPLTKTIAVLGEKTVLIADPTNHERSAAVIIPDLSSAPSNPPVSHLKSRIDEAKPLGIVHNPADETRDSTGEIRNSTGELLLIYNNIGCYIDKHGEPGRKAGYIRWETQASAYAQHGTHVLLFSPNFIEVRDIRAGKLVQVIQGEDMGLMHQSSGPLQLMLIKKRTEDQHTHHEQIAELYETAEIAITPAAATTPTSTSAPTLPLPALAGMWDEWDM